jgi:SAM-dependent methyltransferase
MPSIAPVHPINSFLARFGIRVTRAQAPIPPEFMEDYRRNLALLKQDSRGFEVFEELWCETGEHPASYVNYECSFAARHMSRLSPENTLDIGSNRIFILGLLSHYRVTTLDVRKREPATENEIVVTSDAKDIKIPDGSFDVVVSICAIEHFGLGRYGDKFDLDADRKALSEMARVLRPGGHLIFTTAMTAGRPAIAFNGQRVYSRDFIHERCKGLILVEEKFYSQRLARYCTLGEVTSEPRKWDVYCGCWKKE